MKEMSRFLLCLWAISSLAQTPADLFNKPPSDVDQALRARINEFYQLQAEGKFRQAESLVAEDTKDTYYNASKTKYISFEISRIEYSNEFTRAKATVLCEQIVPIPGFMDKPLKVPIPSYWKIVDGKWYWYVDPQLLRQTPFGVAKVPDPSAAQGATLPEIKIPTAEEMKYIFTQVKADKQQVELAAGGTQDVTITNGAPGPMTLVVYGTPPAGVEATLDRAELKAGEKAVMKIRAGKDAKPGVINVTVQQTSQIIAVKVVLK